jgi:hypothetical protein
VQAEGMRGCSAGRRLYLVGQGAAAKRASAGGVAAGQAHIGLGTESRRPSQGHRILPARGTERGGQEGAGSELGG